ncbi:MAG: hypothetical protein WDO15_27390 [Bacteroidota bacterium]
MKLTLNLAAFLVLVSLIIGCKEKASPAAKQAAMDVIPKAVSVTGGEAAFILSSSTSIYSEGVKEIGDYAASVLHVSASETRAAKNQIFSFFNTGPGARRRRIRDQGHRRIDFRGRQ